MILENLKSFEWYNEPLNVAFGQHEMKITAAGYTDFWQSRHHNISKDNGHFFFSRFDDNFCCLVKWTFDMTQNFNQCGIMVRSNEDNWFKASVTYRDGKPEILSSVTCNGISDWAGCPLVHEVKTVWYKLIRKGFDYAVFWSQDGKNFDKLRQFCLCDNPLSVSAGAYVCSPNPEGFEAVLDQIDAA